MMAGMNHGRGRRHRGRFSGEPEGITYFAPSVPRPPISVMPIGPRSDGGVPLRAQAQHAIDGVNNLGFNQKYITCKSSELGVEGYLE